MNYNQYIYGRERRRFGRQCLFVNRNFLLVSIFPSPRLRVDYILENPLNRSTQLSQQMALSTMFTKNVVRVDHGAVHTEGGWPREINVYDEEQTTRHRKKIERDAHWTTQVTRLVCKMVTLSSENAAISIYQDFFEEFSDAGTEICASFEARQCHTYIDPVSPKRLIGNIDCVVNDFDCMLVVYKPLKMNLYTKLEDDEEKQTRFAIFTWNMNNPLKPLTLYENKTPFYVALNCPKDESIMAGGDFLGKVSLWSTRKAGSPFYTCDLEAAHREPVAALCWVHSKSNTEFYSGSYDGSVKFWDGRNMSEPIVEVLLDPEPTDDQKRARSHGVSVLEFEYTIPVRFIVASEHGHVFVGNRKGGLPTDIFLSNFKLFSGPIQSVQRNPFFVKNFLLAGDWCCKIWAEENKNSPSSFSFKQDGEVLCGIWSPVRCSLFVTGDANGCLCFWDILLDHRQYVSSLKFPHAITAVKFAPEGEFLAVGLSNGDTQMLELDKVMLSCNTRERALASALFEREQARTKLLEGRAEELKLRAKTSIWEVEQAGLIENIMQESEVNPQIPEQFSQMIEADTQFKKALAHFNDIMQIATKKQRERDHLMELTEFDNIHDTNHEDIPI